MSGPYRHSDERGALHVYAPARLLVGALARWVALAFLLIATMAAKTAVKEWIWPSPPAPPGRCHESALIAFGHLPFFSAQQMDVLLGLLAFLVGVFLLVGYASFRHRLPRMVFDEGEVRVRRVLWGTRVLAAEDLVLDLLRPRDLQATRATRATRDPEKQTAVHEGALVLRLVDSSKLLALLGPELVGFERLLREVDAGVHLVRVSTVARPYVTPQSEGRVSAYRLYARASWRSVVWIMVWMAIIL